MILDHSQEQVWQHLSSRLSSSKSWWPFSPPQKSLYIWGPVGRGKTYLMDLFYRNFPSSRKHRCHFHLFMEDLHKKLAHGQSLEEVVRTFKKSWDVLCLDEFHISNIADAMILKRLFTSLLETRLLCVVTSNTAPQDLYREGLHRERFAPFIGFLQDHFSIFHLDGGKDYRRQKVTGAPRYYCPPAPQKIQNLWDSLTDSATPASFFLRTGLTLQRTYHEILWTSFDELCCRPLGVRDYRLISETFSLILLEDLPILEEHHQNEAHRFMTFIDLMYEMKRDLFISAAARPEDLYPKGKGSESFLRTQSRLCEMEYWT